MISEEAPASIFITEIKVSFISQMLPLFNLKFKAYGLKKGSSLTKARNIFSLYLFSYSPDYLLRNGLLTYFYVKQRIAGKNFVSQNPGFELRNRTLGFYQLYQQIGGQPSHFKCRLPYIR